VNPSELHLFYEDLVRKLRDRGVVCAITSGLACVHYGIAETTKDCDLLCKPESFGTLLALLAETTLAGGLAGIAATSARRWIFSGILGAGRATSNGPQSLR